MTAASILDPVHRAAGARFAGEAPGSPLLTYGDVPAEYKAGVEGCALFDATGRGALDMGGDDRLEFCHRILANTVRGLEPGQGNRQLLLSPKGKVLADFELRFEADRFRLSTEPGAAPALAQALDMFLFADKVELTDVTGEHTPLDLCGPKAGEVLSAVLGPLPEVSDYGFASLDHGGMPVELSRVPVAGSWGWRVDAGPAGTEALWRALCEAGAQPAGIVARDCLRVEAGAAIFGVDITDDVYPQEARLEEAFALDKGCYVGQEVVAKIDTYGGLNKRLVALAVSHDDPVPRGAKLIAWDDKLEKDRELGIVTSWAYSFVLDTGLVLAYVKRRHQAVGTEFKLDGAEGTARVVALPQRAGARPITGEFE
ncbi:YgfZ/GcvT domain-containing protein [Engelhardtia mirabilis]|uniref:Aminomethyltransferase n=1 Tax=Engelhardtia mirabilis TaxID=2528011 RepID=A0A518BIX9_9BACT|nr:Aminomethyltransferase [Planctomycetes bacterium Pla133]QDV01255.1 Aminomethyltransferase [Planctomycetes bacterium Pla86]